ncbi:MAG: phage holin family protein [Deltaproteobacteria bacterium]|nr:phage holin family protein [Deltaproteobacteria bacterium]
MSQWLLMWVASGFALWLTAAIVPGMTIASFSTALLVALVLGFLQSVVRPVLVLLTLPVTFLTLGLFLGVINAAVLGLSAYFVSGFAISGFFAALVGTLVLSFVSGIITRMLDRDE